MRFKVLKCFFLVCVNHSAFSKALLTTSNTSRLASSGSKAKMGMIEATDLFGKWAQTEGRVEKMAAGHTPAVGEMLKRLVAHLREQTTTSSTDLRFLDVGCGSGWVCRKLFDPTIFGNTFSMYRGIDGSRDMVLKARSENGDNENCSFQHADLTTWSLPSEESLFDVCFSMECLYYLKPEEISVFLQTLSSRVIRQGGILIFGIDHYEENLQCHGWAELNNCHMTLWKSNRWKEEVEEAGFKIVDMWRAAKRDDMAEGTLVIMARNEKSGNLISDEL